MLRGARYRPDDPDLVAGRRDCQRLVAAFNATGPVVGAGSVVTRDLPAGVLAAGNPCRVLRPIG